MLVRVYRLEFDDARGYYILLHGTRMSKCATCPTPRLSIRLAARESQLACIAT